MTSTKPARTGRLITLATLVLGLVALTPGAAHAKSHTMRDASGDVYKVTGLLNGNQPTKAPGERVADLTSVTTQHSARAVTITVAMRKLPQDAGAAILQVRTSAGGPAYIVQGIHLGNVAFAEMARGFDATEPLECAGLRAKVRTSSRTVAVTVPRACLGNPRWVRVGAGYATVNVANGTLGLMDIAGAKGLSRAAAGGTGAGMPLGARVRRG